MVEGHVSWDERGVEAAIGQDPQGGGFGMMVGGEGAKPASTAMRVLERGYLGIRGPRYGMPVSKLSLVPVTGRRHQLR